MPGTLPAASAAVGFIDDSILPNGLTETKFSKIQTFSNRHQFCSIVRYRLRRNLFTLELAIGIGVDKKHNKFSLEGNDMPKALVTSLAILLLSALPSFSQASIIEILPDLTTVEEGDSFSVDIVVSELAANEFVSAFDLFAAYDPGVVEFIGAVFGPDILATFDSSFLVSGLLGPPFGPGAGTAAVGGLSILPDEIINALQGDSVTIATLTFAALLPGSSALSFADPLPFLPPLDVKGACALGPFDPFCEPLQFDSANTAMVNVLPADVVAVPEPGTLNLALLGLILLGLSGVATRRRQSHPDRP